MKKLKKFKNVEENWQKPKIRHKNIRKFVNFLMTLGELKEEEILDYVK